MAPIKTPKFISANECISPDYVTRYHRRSFLDILMAFLGVRLCHFLSFPMTDVNWGALVYTKACKYTETYSFCCEMPLRSVLRVVFLAQKLTETIQFHRISICWIWAPGSTLNFFERFSEPFSSMDSNQTWWKPVPFEIIWFQSHAKTVLKLTDQRH